MSRWWTALGPARRASAGLIIVALSCLGPDAGAQDATYVCTAARADIHADPSDRAPLLERVPAGTILELVGVVGEWFHVRLPPDPRLGSVRVMGYISRKEAAPVSASEAAAASAAVRRPIVRPPGDGISVGADHAGKTTWLKPSPTRAVPIAADARTAGSIAGSPALLEALASSTPPSGPPAAKTIWVWVTAAGGAAPGLSSRRPSFFVAYQHVDGLDPNVWIPRIVRLISAGPAWAFVSALPGPADAATRDARDWRAQQGLIQSAMPLTVTGSGPGLMQVSLDAPLAAAEYAVVLRPAFDQPYSGARLLGGVAEGIPFGAVWRFSIR